MAFLMPTRTITAPDPDASLVPAVDCRGCDRLTVGATSNTAGASLTFVVVITDGLGNVVGVSAPTTLQASAKADWGKSFLGYDANAGSPVLHCCGPQAFVQVTSLSPPTATWTLGANSV
jgi:hypothetical protein